MFFLSLFLSLLAFLSAEAQNTTLDNAECSLTISQSAPRLEECYGSDSDPSQESQLTPAVCQGLTNCSSILTSLIDRLNTMCDFNNTKAPETLELAKKYAILSAYTAVAKTECTKDSQGKYCFQVVSPDFAINNFSQEMCSECGRRYMDALINMPKWNKLIASNLSDVRVPPDVIDKLSTCNGSQSNNDSGKTASASAAASFLEMACIVLELGLVLIISTHVLL
jgi:hypothetical protein